MPRRAFSLEEKHRSAVQRRNKILDGYNGDRNIIMMEGQRYKRTKQPSLKQIYNDYRHLLILENKINDLKEIIDCNEDAAQEDRALRRSAPQDRTLVDDTLINNLAPPAQRQAPAQRRAPPQQQDQLECGINSDEEDGVDNTDHDEKCDNCSRMRRNSNDDDRYVILNKFNFLISISFINSFIYLFSISLFMQMHNSDTICKHRKFKFIIVPNNRIVSFKLCAQCSQHLTLPELQEANKPEFTWPAFIWGLLNDTNIKRKYGETYI